MAFFILRGDVQKVIDNLKEKGLIINDEINTIEYLEYNTTWQLLKPSREMFKGFQNGKYNNLTFDDIRMGGLVNFYYSRAFEILIKTFEHQIKVYLSRIYSLKNKVDKQKINNDIKLYIEKKQKKFINKINEIEKTLKNPNFEFFQLYDYYYLSDLIAIYNNIFKEKKFIEPKINNIRNKVSHHDNLLYFDTKQKLKPVQEREQVQEKILNTIFSDTWSEEKYETKKYIKKNYNKFLLTEQIYLIDLVHYFLSKNDCTFKMKKYVFNDFIRELEKSIKYYQKLNCTNEWLDEIFIIIMKYELYLNI